MRTNIDINESFVRKAKKLTRLKTKRQIVDKALEFLFVQRAGMAFCDTTAVVFGGGSQSLAEKPGLILADSSVWIDFLSSSPSSTGAELRRMIADAEPFALAGVIVGDSSRSQA